MTDTFPAFDISPVPVPGPDARAPEPFHGIYGMPAFLTVATADLDASRAFWIDVLGFFELFAAPGRLVHLRRWTFQDVLLLPAETGAAPASAPATGTASTMTVSFAAVLSELDALADAARAAGAAVVGPSDTRWNTRDVAITTPDGAALVFTAARPFVPGSAAAADLAEIGIGVEAGGEE